MTGEEVNKDTARDLERQREKEENKAKRRVGEKGQASNQSEVGVKIIACTLLSETVICCE